MYKFVADSYWIQFNKPWTNFYDKDPPRIPVLAQELKNHFGSISASKYKLGSDSLKIFKEQEHLFGDHISPELEDKFIKWINDSKLTDFVKNICKSLILYRKQRRAEDEWINNHPKMIQYLEDRKKFDLEEEKFLKENSFIGARLNKPGTLIEIEANGSLSQYLLGDLNPSGDYRGLNFDEKCIVRRYKVLLELCDDSKK